MVKPFLQAVINIHGTKSEYLLNLRLLKSKFTLLTKLQRSKPFFSNPFFLQPYKKKKIFKS